VSEEDPRFTAVVAAFAAERALAPIAAEYAARKETGGRKFGSNGLKVNGKLFAFVGRAGRLVVKLPKTRVAELAAARKGEPFDPGHGRVMKEWLCVTGAKVSWLELAREAHDFVKGAR
jgi:hypothetical protein